MDSQSRTRGSSTLSRQLSRAGLALFAVFIVTVTSSLLPLRLTDPSWQLQLSAALINNGSMALLGFLLIALANWLAPDDERLERRHTLVRRLALLAVVGYLLVIPLQTMALWRGIDQAKQRQSRERRVLEERIEAITRALETAKTPADLQSQLQRLPGAPQLPAAQLSEPMPQLRQRFAAALTFARSRLGASSAGPTPAQVQKLIQESVRISLSALALAFAFAAGAQLQGQGRGPSLLDEFQQARESARRRRLRL